jgi:polyhydroxybutyrate depolymerase
MVETSGPTRAMPLMLFNSVDDRYVPYAGRVGLLGRFSHAERYPQVPSVDEEVARWHRFDGCPASARVGPELKGASGSADAGNTATRYEWGPCEGGSRIVLWKLSGSGHVWPGAARKVFYLGRGTQVIDANDQMWRFFRQMWRFFRDFSLAPDKRAH